MRDAITQSYGFGEKNPLFEKREQKLYLTSLPFLSQLMFSRFLEVWVQQWAHQGLPQTKCHPTYLQAAENGKEIVKCHDVAVHRHQTQQPRGTDEQQEQERCSQHRAVKQTQTGICSAIGYMRIAQLLRMGGATCPVIRQLERTFGKIRAVFTSSQFPTLSLHYSVT